MLGWGKNGKFGWAKTENFVGNFSERRVVPYAEVNMTDDKIKEVVRELCKVAFRYAPPEVLKELAKKLNQLMDMDLPE